MKNVLEFSKQLLSEKLNENSIVVDATVWNGNDTVYLCSKYKFVYGFDIQSEAIKNTRKRLEDFDNYKLILDSHENVDKYIDQCDGAIFNLGYLPNASNNVTTDAKSTISAIEAFMKIIKNGIIVLVIYVGHDNGVEGNAIEDYLTQLDSDCSIVKYQFLNRMDAPYVIGIKMRRK